MHWRLWPTGSQNLPSFFPFHSAFPLGMTPDRFRTNKLHESADVAQWQRHGA